MNDLKKFKKQSLEGQQRLYLYLTVEEANAIGWQVSGLVQAVEVVLDLDDKENITGGIVNFGEPDDISCYGSDYLDEDDALEVFQLIEKQD